MGFQKCPVCNGTGRLTNTLSSSTFKTCDTCKGRKMINEWTGLPPKTNDSATDINEGINGNCETQQEYFGKQKCSLVYNEPLCKHRAIEEH